MQQSVPSQAGGMTPVGVGFAPKKNEALPWILGGVAALLVALIGLGASGLLRVGGKSGSANLAANGRLAGADLREKGNLNAPPLNANMEGMPQDVYDWLKHLEKTEKMKQDLAAHQMDAMTVDKNRMGAAEGLNANDVGKLSDPEGGVELPEGLKKAFDDIASMGKDWQKVKDFFDSKPPPAECKPIADAYDNGLEGMVDAISKVSAMTGQFADPNTVPGDASASSATENLHDVARKHVTDIDGQLQVTDDLVDKICKKYGVTKWFRIDAHGGGANPLAGLGGG
jgi:hypothetical protein